ncbi:MAG: hypothetical protein J0M11_07015 [Anaerolineae bacterium]|nr:hypothetical protein [Anaerolineae bacterium]
MDDRPLTILFFHRPSSIVHGLKNKKPFIHIRDEEFSPWYHPNYVFKLERSNVSTLKPANVTLAAITGTPGGDYFIHQRSCSYEQSGEFGLKRSLGRWCWALTSLSQLTDGMTYYSCFDF